MGKDACRIKGTRHGLTITIAEDVGFEEVLTQLERKLLAARDFFAGASVRVELGGRLLEPSQSEAMERIIEEYGMVLDQEPDPSSDLFPVGQKYQENTQTENSSREEELTVLIKRTLRSGQRVHYDGNVVVMGDVNPGAEIVCSGDILVLGSLRGVAHAGVKGNTNSVVFAFRLEPTQLRIAHYISRAPDEKLPQPLGPEVASIIDNLIQIRSYSH